MGMFKDERRGADPIPDSSSIFGEWMAPAARITSCRAKTA
jgi:hypothetical protein